MRRAARPLLGAHIYHREFDEVKTADARTYSDARLDLWSLLCLCAVACTAIVFVAVPDMNTHLATALVYVYAMVLMVLSNGLLQHPSPTL